MLKSFILAGVMSGGFIFLFSVIGLYGNAFGLPANPSVSVPASFGLVMMLLFNGIMLLSGGSTIDSTFTSVSKLTALDWQPNMREAGRPTTGRIAILIVAVVGNLPLLAIYAGDKLGPAIIAATTISGTMVMGLAPIFLLSWLPSSRALSFHLAFWPGLIIGISRAVETFVHVSILPASLALGTGKYALDLGLNVYGLLVCTCGFLVGAVLERERGFGTSSYRSALPK